MKNKNVLLFCLLLTIMGGIVMPTFGSEITDVGYFDTDAIQPVLFEDPNGNVYEIKVPAEQAEAWERQQEEKVNASKGVGSHATTYETQAEQDNISMHERALLVASEKQKELLEEARASCKWGAVGDCTRQIMQKMGQLDTNTPRLTLEQAEELCGVLTARTFFTSEELEAFVVGVFNCIAGAPDFEGGSGIQRYVYYLNEEQTQYIGVMLGRVYHYNEITGQITILYQY